MNFKPYNRHLLINPIEEDQIEQTGILLPDDYKSKNPFGVGKAVDVASDCTLDIFAGEKVVYSTNMLENVTIGGKDYFLLLENYVLGVINEKD
jgi:co-chaperonin GroES (HSP10)|tara:strand:- start:1363 stop:1641 length:279 start_codon:yes stop_codon:yes gene_type:complete